MFAKGFVSSDAAVWPDIGERGASARGVCALARESLFAIREAAKDARPR